MSKQKKQPKQPKIQTCQFISVTHVVPKSMAETLWEKISENAPFSWGDNNRSLVTASSFADHCQERLDDSQESQDFLSKLRELGETYLDLES
jgi:hypothetical protein